MPRPVRVRRSESGFTLVELSLAGFLCAIVLAAVALIFTSVSKGASDAGLRAELQTEAREIVTDLAAELRSAVSPAQGAMAIESLTANSLVFFSDRYPTAGPERFVYERTACTGGYCQLRVRRYAANSASGPNWTFQTVPFNDTVLLERVASASWLFAGRAWAGSPLQLTTVASCGGASKCTFSIVAVDLQAAVPGVDSIDGPYGIFVEVNLRNV